MSLFDKLLGKKSTETLREISEGRNPKALQELTEALELRAAHVPGNAGCDPRIEYETYRQSFGPDVQKRYNFIEAMKSYDRRTGPTGLYKEVSQEIAKLSGIEPAGFFVPDFCFTRRLIPDLEQTVKMWESVNKRDLSAGGIPSSTSGTGGGSFVPLYVEPSLISYLYKHTVLKQAGAVTLANLRGNINLPRENTANTATWAAENAVINRTAPAFDNAATLSPKRVGTVTAYANSLLAQSSLDVQNIVIEDILRVIAVAIDQAALFGSGPSNNQPTGLLTLTANTAGNYDPSKLAPPVTFGGTATLQSILQFYGNVTDCNVEDDASMSYITTPLVKAKLKAIPAAVNYPRYLWQGDAIHGNSLALGLAPGFVTKLLDQNVTGQVLFGKFSDLVIGQWAGLDLVVDPYTLADYHQTRIVIHALVDVGIRHAISFCASTDAGNQ